MRIAPGQNTKPKPMYIITNKNELFEYYYDTALNGHQLLYHSGEVSIRAHVYRDYLPAWASLPGQLRGIYLERRHQGSDLVGCSWRSSDWGPYVEARLGPVKYEHPTLGEIPPEHRETLKEVIKELTSRAVGGHEILKSKLEEAGQSL